jgi:hypothetical protein
VFFALGGVLRPCAGSNNPAKIQMDGGTDPFGAFDAGKSAEPPGQFPGASDGRSGGRRRIEDPI